MFASLVAKKTLTQSVHSYSHLARCFQVTQVRSFASDTLKDKEKGDERIFFTKNDGK